MLVARVTVCYAEMPILPLHFFCSGHFSFRGTIARPAKKNSHCNNGYLALWRLTENVINSCVASMGKPSPNLLPGTTPLRSARSLIGKATGLSGVTICLGGKTRILGRRAAWNTGRNAVGNARWNAERDARWVAVWITGLLPFLHRILPDHEFGVFPTTPCRFPRHFSTSLK